MFLMCCHVTCCVHVCSEFGDETWGDAVGITSLSHTCAAASKEGSLASGATRYPLRLSQCHRHKTGQTTWAMHRCPMPCDACVPAGSDLWMRAQVSSRWPRTPALKKRRVLPIWYMPPSTLNSSSRALHISRAPPLALPAPHPTTCLSLSHHLMHVCPKGQVYTDSCSSLYEVLPVGMPVLPLVLPPVQQS